MKLDVLSRENGGTGHDSRRTCRLSMTQIDFAGRFADSERAVISLIWDDGEG